MQQRVDAFGVAEPELAAVRHGPDRGQPAGRRGRRARRRSRSARPPSCSSTTGKRTSSTRTARPTRTQNANSGRADHRAATRRSSRRRSARASAAATRAPTTSQAAAKPRFYASTRRQEAAQQRAAVRLPRRTRCESLTAGAAARNAEVVEVPAGVLVAARPEGRAPTTPAAGPLVGHPGPPGAVAARTSRTRSRASTSRPATSRSSRSTSRTRAARRSRTITREIAQRGADNALPAATRSTTSQHFAIALDNELVSAPYINCRENPDGIDGSTGAQISGSFTIQSRAGPGEDPQDRRAAAEARAESRARRSPRRSASRRSTRA